MSRLKSAAAMMGAALLALLALDGCDGQRPEASAPPPVASTPPPAITPDLMGGPPQQAAQPAANPPPVEEQTFTAMAPVANPEDMSPEERAQVYGHRYDHLTLAGERRSARRHHLTRYFIGDGRRASAGLGAHHHLTRYGRWRRYAHGWRMLHAHGARTGRTSLASHSAAKAQAGGGASPAPAEPATSATASAPPAAPAAQPASANLDWLSIPGAPYVNLPGFGRVPSRFVTAALLLALAIALLVIAAGRGHAAGRRRRPAREAVGAGPAFADERASARAPGYGDADLAPFPHREPAEPARS